MDPFITEVLKKNDIFLKPWIWEGLSVTQNSDAIKKD